MTCLLKFQNLCKFIQSTASKSKSKTNADEAEYKIQVDSKVPTKNKIRIDIMNVVGYFTKSFNVCLL